MTDVVEAMINRSTYDYSNELNSPADRLVETWPLMSSPIPIVSILVFYLYFVLSLGPKLMESRKPFNLKYVMIVYNLYNVINSIYMVMMVLGDIDGMKYLYNHQCNPMDRRINPWVYKVNFGSYLYFMSKIVELLDTVFFVLRKKQSQITLLHVYHHANMAASTWAYLKYIRGEQGILIGFINSLVHVVMYTYYLLAALGPHVQKYLWWKKYITKLQLVQFVIILIYCSALLANDCTFPKGLTYYAVLQASIFFGLFLDFYRKAYIKNKDKKETKSS